ncbi:hypothetical protein [Cytophaga aurantiaca]|uniref:DUF7822 domain-containing protein n=1 Tax=Cytophaga aurantiaca TaxID=29530 RepID=UPI00036F1D8A|nr:hypothetical protein [Cytophaga aurantiaca]
MANRSYLYAINFDRTLRKKQDSDSIKGVSENNYEIPLIHKILVSQESKLSPSIIWEYDHPISIIGNFYKGKEKLFDFLIDLKQRGYYDHQDLDKLIETTKIFLNDESNSGAFAYLEAGELYMMGNEAFEIQNQKIYEEILNYNQMISDFYKMIELKNTEIIALKKIISGKNKGFLNFIFKSSNSSADIEKINKEIYRIESEKHALLCVDNWSKHLYFDFSNK